MKLSNCPSEYDHELVSVSSYMEGFRFLDIEGLIRKSALDCKLDVLEIKTTFGFLQKTVFFKLEGTVFQVRQLNKHLKSLPNISLV